MNHPGLRVTVLGGGNGISTVLQGFAARLRGGRPLAITAVVAASDDGGSSGRIRRHRGGLPPGDLRRCLLALAGADDRPLTKLFRHRWEGRGELAGHVLGNLVLSALADQHGCYLRAVEVAGRMLEACGRVLPVTLEAVRLRGVTRDGRRLSGESRIGAAPTTMRRVALSPAAPRPAPGVIPAIREADLVVLGPGSLFTSILPVLLVPGVPEAIRECAGSRVLVSNLMTQPGESLDMDLRDHLETLDRHVGPGLVRHVLACDEPIPAARLRPYAARRSRPVAVDSAADRPERILKVPLMSSSGKIRHDPDRLSAALLALVEETGVAAGRAGPARAGRMPAAMMAFGIPGAGGKGSH